MPNGKNIIFKYNHGEKSLKAPFMIYADSESILEKTHSCQNNPEKSYTEKKAYTLRLLNVYKLFIWYNKKTNFIVTKGKSVWKCFVNT